MQISLSGHHVDITPTIKSYVETKLNRLEQHNDRITNVAVILSVDKLRQRDQSTSAVARFMLPICTPQSISSRTYLIVS